MMMRAARGRATVQACRQPHREPRPAATHQPSMNHRPPPSAAPESVLPVQAFLQAAEQGLRVWVERTDDGVQVRGGRGLPAAADTPTLALFAAALRARYGAQATKVALRDLHHQQPPRAGALDARAVRAAIERAESLQALYDAQAQLWRLEFSAVMLGRRFMAVCERCGIQAQRLPLARREAIDAAMGWPDPASVEAEESAEQLAQRLQGLLLQALH